MQRRWFSVLVLFASCSCAASPVVRSPPEPVRFADGAIVTLRPILSTPTSEYFELTYTSSGLRVNGYLARPRDRTVRHPAVIWNRGGNRSFGLVDPGYLIPYAEAGYVTVASQYRGNSGSEGKEDFGGEDVEDVLNLIPLLKAQPDVDGARIAMVGYSRGGMMTYRALREDARRGRNDISVAAVVGGTADLDDLEQRPDMGPVYQDLIGCLPAECPGEYVMRSAVHWAGEIRAPLLLLHGEADWRVDVSQARRVAAVMNAAGRTVKLVTYPDDDHGLTQHGHGQFAILEWLGQHLGMPRESWAPERLGAAMDRVMRAWPPSATGEGRGD